MAKERVEIKDAPTVANFDAVKILVASPETILSWSHGEVIKPETINYRTQKPERDGLFCEKIFGPTKDWECYCGKYKKIRYKGIVCDKCGVEVTRSQVRRVRMGHIDLAVPAAHIWYSRGTSPVVAQVLDLTSTNLEKIAYFASFVIMEVNEEIRKSSLSGVEAEYKDYIKEMKESDSKVSEASKELKKQKIDAAYKEIKAELTKLNVKDTISEKRYHDMTLKYGQIVKVAIGAEAVLALLKKVDLNEEIKISEERLKKDKGPNQRKILKRIRTLNSLKTAEVKPEHLILSRIPVIPPDLRPMVQLDGGRFAASDLNDLYRRVLNRNNRLKRLIVQGAPEVICRNEKRMLQEAVDALIDNSARKGKVAFSAGGKRKLRSLSDMIRGKQGRFRQNLLGKRVDYSGRSVIVVGPTLKLHQCGIPKLMALELFKPFVIGRLIRDGFVHNVKNATRLIERGEEFVWDILEDITKDHKVLLNRAPTLHRLGIQAFQPVLIEGKAIQIHPLVCPAFNADFDGDQMAVHVPLSKQARKEADEIMLSSKNLLKPASGEPIVSPELDIVFGVYYMTMEKDAKIGNGRVFSSTNDAISSYDRGELELHSKIKVKLSSGKIVDSTPGRVLVNETFPEEIEFINDTLDKKKIKALVFGVYQKFGKEATAKLVDDIKKLGFEYAQKSGITFSVDDIHVPKSKGRILKKAEEKVTVIEHQYQKGFLTPEEKYAKTVELWMDTSSIIEGEMLKNFEKNNDIYIVMNSGARGNASQLHQIAGMKGMVADPTGNIIEIPIKSNFKEGLSVFEYFVSTHGSRKGRADTALRTSQAGYLTRRLVDVAQDSVITTDDCGAKEFRAIRKEFYTSKGKGWLEHLIGRVLARSVAGVKAGTLMTEEDAQKIDAIADEAEIRSLLYCKAERGICKFCYGQDPASGGLIEIGSTVGIVAAQAIGEPGTQLTMRTFHTGGVAGEDITAGLPRVEEIFESRTPKSPAVISEIDGVLSVEKDKNSFTLTVSGRSELTQAHVLPVEYKFIVKNGDKVKPKQVIAEADNKKPIRANNGGVVKINKNEAIISGPGKTTSSYTVSRLIELKFKDGDKIKKGDALTEGHFDLSDAVKLIGLEITQNYIIEEAQKIYESQGQSINDKHVEIITRQMLSKVRISATVEKSNYMVGQVVDYLDVLRENVIRKTKGDKKIEFERIIMGISRVALRTKSFLSAASFMETTSVLIDAAISGKTDELKGLKENIIIGKLIPAGTGYKSR